jgi:hypothetical protein
MKVAAGSRILSPFTAVYVCFRGLIIVSGVVIHYFMKSYASWSRPEAGWRQVRNAYYRRLCRFGRLQELLYGFVDGQAVVELEFEPCQLEQGIHAADWVPGFRSRARFTHSSARQCHRRLGWHRVVLTNRGARATLGFVKLTLQYASRGYEYLQARGWGG